MKLAAKLEARQRRTGLKQGIAMIKHSEVEEREMNPMWWTSMRAKGHLSNQLVTAPSVQVQVNALLNLIAHVAKDMAEVTFKNEPELRKACDATAAELTPVQHHSAIQEGGANLQGAYKVYMARTADGIYNPAYIPASTENVVPLALILYTDKSKLSSFGTVKGYPIVVRCGNLPVGIRNSADIGRGTVVGWLSIVPEDAKKEGKLGYTMLKCMVWHESFLKLLDKVVQHSVTGTTEVQEALAAWVENRARGEELLKKLGLQPVDNVFWIIRFSDPHRALSFDRLHALHLGLWGKHILEELKKILAFLGRESEATVEKYIAEFPSWWNLSHFNAMINITFNDGNKMCDLAKQTFYSLFNVLKKNTVSEGYTLLQMLQIYLELDGLISLDVHTETTLSMIKKELLQFNDTLNNYIELATKSNIEGLKVDWGFPKVHLWKHVVKDIRWRHMTDGQTEEMSPARFYELITTCLLQSYSGCITEHQYVQVNYSSTVNWRKATDYLWCNLCFFGKPQYDCAVIQLIAMEVTFVHLILVFTCHILELDGMFEFALVQSYLTRTGPARQLDCDLKLSHVKASVQSSSIFIPVASIIHGALLAPDTGNKDDAFIVNYLDDDMFLHMKV
ncbi:hypothetical protein HD554DRAFT_2038953 [Boletus coccyginus]|nr:hypothetical protein HD554DRAFT_2038953 [Boletus coccyginus]